MAVGWANDDSVSQQIQNTIDDEISRVRGNIIPVIIEVA